jgi:hypothetical protein
MPLAKFQETLKQVESEQHNFVTSKENALHHFCSGIFRSMAYIILLVGFGSSTRVRAFLGSLPCKSKICENAKTKTFLSTLFSSQ